MKRFKIVLVATFVMLAVAIYAIPVKTASAEPVGSASLGIIPRKDYIVNAGSSVKDTLSVTNLDSTQPLVLTLRPIDFTYTGSTGTPKLMLADDAPQTPWSLKPYLSLPTTMTVPAGGTQTVSMSVAIPANVGAGSYYSAILYSTGAPGGGNVGLSASGVTLVFVTVPGQVNESLTLKQFGAYNLSTQTATPGYVTFAQNQPQGIGYTLKNSGNVTEAPVGTITMEYMFGQKTLISNVNSDSSLALIGQTRVFTTCIKLQPETVDLNGDNTQSTTCAVPDLWPGRYSLSLDVYYGLNGNTTKEVVGTSSFWYLPVWFVVTFVIIVLILAIVIWRLYVKIHLKLYGRTSRNSYRRK
jgi:hypothetical protein